MVYCLNTWPEELKQDNQFDILNVYILFTSSASKPWIPEGEWRSWEKKKDFVIINTIINLNLLSLQTGKVCQYYLKISQSKYHELT